MLVQFTVERRQFIAILQWCGAHIDSVAVLLHERFVVDCTIVALHTVPGNRIQTVTVSYSVSEDLPVYIYTTVLDHIADPRHG